MPHVQIDGLDAHYMTAGVGERVIAVHASSSSSSQWKKLFTKLSTSFELVAPDLFGSGDTPSHYGTPKEAEEADARLVVALVEDCERPVHLVGHSYGGRLAAAASLRAKRPVASLTLIEPTVFQLLPAASEGRAWAEVTDLANTVIGRYEAGEHWDAADAFIAYWVAPGALEKFPERLQQETVAGIGVVANSWKAVLDLPGQPSLGDYCSIQCPTLVVEGGQSTYAIGRVAHLLRGAIPQCVGATIEKAGHMAPVTHADSVNSHIVEHIRRHSDKVGDR